jgi:endoglucanase
MLMTTGFAPALLAAIVIAGAGAVGPGEPVATISECDAPFLFAYGSWEGRVRMEQGHALLRGPGVTPRGGAGCNVQVNLKGHENDCPVLNLKTGTTNTGKAIRLLLRDSDGRVGTWEFALPAPSTSFQFVVPRSGEPLSKPTTVEKTGAPDLAHVMQWQLGGDWSGDGPLDVDVDAIAVVKPGAEILALRTALARREAEEHQRRRAEQAATRQKYGKRTELSPTVERVSLVAPRILAIEIQAGKVIPGSLGPYKPRSGDERQPRDKDRQLILKRNGEEIGWLIGPKRDQLVRYERCVGDPLVFDDVTGDPARFTFRSRDDPAFATGLKPTAIHHKSKPTDWAQPGQQFAMLHTLYLVLPKPVTPGKRYDYDLGELNVQSPRGTFTCDPTTVRSEAVHSQQIGYRPDDPVKRAFLSIWLGTGGAYTYPPGLTFTLRDDTTGAVAFTGAVETILGVDQKEKMFREENFPRTAVARLDFSAFQKPGRYRVCVEGIGSGYPFEIGPKVWGKAFLTQMRGLYNERSGVALGPPYTSFKKPRDFHPADGVRVTRSTYSALEAGGEAFEKLAKGDTGQPVPGAWGGYHDAGDWNPRRATHLQVTLAQLEIFDMFPEVFAVLRLNIPPGPPRVPDVLTEALFEIDCFQRLQEPDGSVSYGIETPGDPIDGEVSWLQSMPAYVYAADPSSSWVYASAAARASKLLAKYDPDLAATYRASALKAMQWAEADRARRKAAGTLAKLGWEITDQRNLAAIILFDLTGEAHWHDVFREDSCLKDRQPDLFVWGRHVQRDAAFVYARLPGDKGDPVLKARAVRGLEVQADRSLAYAKDNAFNITTNDRGRPMFIGFYSTPDAADLVRAHFLTGKPRYLAGAVQATQFAAGCNPNNMTYTVGVGSNWTRHPLHLDSRRTGQPAPEGLTVYGNLDFERWNDDGMIWPMKWFLGKECVPSAYEWPIPEAYWDIFIFPMINEFTVDRWWPNIYVWGYLHARR